MGDIFNEYQLSCQYSIPIKVYLDHNLGKEELKKVRENEDSNQNQNLPFDPNP